MFFSVSSDFLGNYTKFRPNFFKNFLIFLQNPFSKISKNFSNFSKCLLTFPFLQNNLLGLLKIFPFSKISLKIYSNLKYFFVISPMFPRKFFNFFLEIIRINFIISLKRIQDSLKSYRNSAKFLNNFHKIISKRLKNLLKIFVKLYSSFLEKNQ